MNITSLSFRASAFRIMGILNVGLFIFALLLAPWHSTWIEVLLIGLPAAVIPLLLYRLLGDHQLARISFGISFMLFAALHIHQSMGMTEIHFGIFVLLAVLIAFRDWLVILVAAAVIAVHHLLFMYLQSSGAGVYLVPESDATLTIVMIHAAFVVVESIALVLICRSSLREAQISQAFFDVTQNLVTADGKIVLSTRCPEMNSPLLKQFNETLQTLHQSVSKIEQSINAIKEEAHDMLVQGDDLSSGMKQKLKEVESIAAATEQMSHNIVQTNQLAQQVLEASEESEKAATSGKSSVTQTQHLVQQLSQQLTKSKEKVTDMAGSTEQIKTVLQVIENIAEQTNLLALNAAIEAARAGEQGRGFAVVADEVRNLAGKTQGSTEQIKKTIDQLIKSSEESVQAVETSLGSLDSTLQAANESDQWLQAIAEKAQQVTSSAHTIANALDQQSAASGEMAHSAQELSGMEHEQSHQGERVAQSAQRLENITRILTTEAQRFSL
ncbi:methyl-accepting chemotaxis protein [Aliidiomarina minuta]|uniref:Methyl-accepting chemotaxis protein n=1 Tax=Aliidiomarina minuta TaxID=880057 RepID=A0A432W9C7_9GAMM|nr:methyl-accepting chemotaxis protein [Aliidiomarina minuta]RUO26702.1 methyl-accepting chemotaxis protein [Aliidiomarina minuta]